jgi:hypothetical protein
LASVNSQTHIAELEATLDRVRAVAQKFADAARDHFGPRLVRIRLYGSAARGDWTPESDIDVLVLLDQVTSGDMDWICREATRHGLLDSGWLLQPLPMPADEFERLKNQERSFALDVEKIGREL